MRRFGFGKPTGVDLPGEEQGIVPRVAKYSGSSMGNLPIGQGISVTPMQIATAYSAIANGGILRPPHSCARIDGTLITAPARQAHHLRARPRRTLRTMLEGVLAPGGTAAEVAIPGYKLAGKTGTANKVDPRTGEYSKANYVASFVGFAPADNPRLLVSVMVDEPQGAIYGGAVAAPAFGKIAAFAPAATCAIPPALSQTSARGMTLREVIGDAAPRRPGRRGRRALAYDNRDGHARGPCSSACPGSRATATTSRPTPSSAAPSPLVVERPLGLGVPEVVVADVRAAMAPAAARLHGDPTASLRTIGITGTNGKTTSAHLVRALLEAAGHADRAAGHGQPGRRRVRDAGRRARRRRRSTSSGRSREMVQQGDEACVMEVSSHALRLRRADAIHWAVAIFTNLTQDHLDFHPDMEDYFAAKRELFLRPRVSRPSRRRRPSSTSTIRTGRRLAADLPDAITIGIDSPTADSARHRPAHELAGTTFTADGRSCDAAGCPGTSTCSTRSAAIAAVRAFGVSDDVIADGLAAFGRVPGRFEPVDEGQDFAVLVDYAHTPDALENVLRRHVRWPSGPAGDSSASSAAAVTATARNDR